jgi:hypothetical protein
MAFTEKRLAGPTALTANTETNLYVCPTAQTTTTLIKQVLVTNTGSATTFDLSLVPQGGTAGTANRLFSALTLSTNETVLLDVSQVMSSGDFISAKSGAGSTVNVTISGVENSGLMVVSGLADSAVTTAKIADGNITVEKLGPDIFADIFQSNVVTSTTRPLTPFEGQVIYETDTNINQQYDGANWGPTYPGSGFRNRLINGGFDIWQRWVATSINVSAGATAYTADRWFMSPVGALMGAIRDSNVPPTSLSRYSLQIAPNASSGGTTCNLGQRIEAANVYALKGTVTFSAWIFNNTSASMTPVLLLGTPSAPDNFTTVTNRLTQSLQSCANGAWTKVTHTVDISGYTNIDNGLQLEIQTSGHTTFGRIVRIAEVQLERNPQPTPFEQRPIGTELALCQRYYQIGRLAAAGYGIVATVDSGAYGNFSFPTRMRAAPTITELTKALGGSPAGYGSGTTYIDASGFGFRYNHGGGGGGSGSGNLSFDLTWSAASEL